MKLNTLILFTLTLILFSSCKKKKNEKLFVGTYSGEWHHENTHYAVDATMTIVPVLEVEINPGGVEVEREGDQVTVRTSESLCKGFCPAAISLDIEELEEGKTFSYNSPTGAMGVASVYTF